MNSVLKQIKPKLLEHYYNTEDPLSQVLVLQQQIDTLNKRVEVYRAEHSKLKERFEGGFVNDPAILEA
jgi:predicted nuclease with TOPRIM domain